jgi:hypothetical protein
MAPSSGMKRVMMVVPIGLRCNRRTARERPSTGALLLDQAVASCGGAGRYLSPAGTNAANIAWQRRARRHFLRQRRGRACGQGQSQRKRSADLHECSGRHGVTNSIRPPRSLILHRAGISSPRMPSSSAL